MYRFLSHYYEMLFPYRQYVAWKDFARPMLRRSRAVRSFKDRGERPLVIDAGCGTGALADLLATYYDVIGIDISEEMLDQALKNYPDRGILWVRQDIAKMETGKTAPSVKILIWWADKFDVSLDYLCCRTDKPEGKIYECRKPPEAVENDKRQFIEMCFDSRSPESKRLKELLFQMWTEEDAK